LVSWFRAILCASFWISPQEGSETRLVRRWQVYPASTGLSWVSQADLAPGRAQDLIPTSFFWTTMPSVSTPEIFCHDLVALVPGTGVILLSKPDATSLARQAVLAGASGLW